MLHGTHRKDRHNAPGDEPQFEDGIGECPDFLGEEATAEWNRIVGECRKVPGLLKRVDRAALTGYCAAWAQFEHCERVLQDEGLTFVTEKGYVGQRPEVAIRRQALDTMKAFLTEFGFTPASRSRLKMSPAKAGKEEGKLGRYVG